MSNREDSIPGLSPTDAIIAFVEAHETFQYTLHDTMYVWTVTRAKQIVNESEHEIAVFELEKQGLTPEVVLSRYPTLDMDRVAVSNPDIPGIAVELNGKALLIDGWHRLMRAAQLGYKEFPVYLLTEEEHQQCLILKKQNNLASDAS